MGDVADGVRAWAAVMRVHAALTTRFNQELTATLGMPLTWYDVLLELDAAPDRRLRMSELGERVTVSRTWVSRVAQDLAAAGLIVREPNPEDRRSSIAVITAEGRRRLRRAAPVYLAAIERHFLAHLKPNEVAVIADAFERVLAANA